MKSFLYIILLLWAFKSLASSAPINIQPNQLSGSNSSAVFLHDTPIGNVPLPYGFENNVMDIGWIWEIGDELIIDFQAPIALSMFRVWSTYSDGTRGAIWDISASDDGANFSHVSSFSYFLSPGGGVNDDGNTRSDYAGWYQAHFNPANSAHQFWKIRDAQTLAQHSPRSGRMEFFSSSIPEAFPGRSLVLVSFLGLIALRGHRKCWTRFSRPNRAA